jgi:magnesium-transporting ATPase (P-type)
MYWLNLAISVTLLILGGILLLYRLMYMFCQGEPWNNPPSLLTWRFTFIVGGATILIAALASPAYECSDSACEKNYSIFSTMVAVGIFLLALPLSWWCFKKLFDNLPVDEQPEPPQRYNFDPETRQDLRGNMSGYDILFLIMGAGILLIDRSLDVCNCP